LWGTDHFLFVEYWGRSSVTYPSGKRALTIRKEFFEVGMWYLDLVMRWHCGVALAEAVLLLKLGGLCGNISILRLLD